MKIGIYSGTFNPIHFSHIILGSYITDFLDIDEVWYLVSPQNPLKTIDSNFQPESVRYEMAKLALADYPKLKASDYEFTLEKPSYTYKTLQALKKDFPEHDFYLIIGADNWLQFDHWKNYKYILDNFPIIIFNRLGYDVETTNINTARVILANSPIIDISSTFIRNLIKNKKEFSPYLPLNVANYIKEHNLYL